MLKIASLVTATILLSSCSSTVEELYQKVAPRPAVVTSQEDVSATQESIIAADSSSFQSQEFAGNHARSAAQNNAARMAVAQLKNSGAKFVLHFSYDGSEIDEAATQEVIKHANFMRDNPALNLRLEGHADERGTREYNLALGENRALAVKEILGLYDLSSRVNVISFGEENPTAQLHNESAWQQNRRVEFIYQ
ncbi:OmpA family protein [Candidatus Thioglobus sp.]|jgi:peptidoglycan-associated lipoprotein|uniref:OmpA family protein n=1 Tax=Candidatus Thioglobus sp. TaxID=2026721 RepID=UPI001D5C3B80|nr:OmpA family protein [Candidatus Thioglobus sp.]MBT3277365.1 OmpA family protein [Candidatus Thioglobus sp.]MBT3744359.1 OmpA family protein [Candidatus Thioglobus sp.]MBT4000466.1 OmpA family protein [Candidatus Thioglobus sp.]MBT4182394.1 OmpA family protein [Candidatus Thioglobus sp.]MBT4747476.1 OmpA family protein [Candidatus Thioglobus sp.]